MTADPTRSSQIGPFENIDPDVCNPFIYYISSLENYYGILCFKIEN